MSELNEVSKEVALKEVSKWLDYKKVDDVKRSESTEAIESLAKAIESGYLGYDSKENKFIQKLKWPIGEGDSIKSLTYKPRLSMNDVHVRTKNVKSGDAHGLITAYICALTEQNSGLIGCLDTEDNRVAQSIATFFL